MIDAIQEFKIESNSPPAEFGRFNGGVVNLTTRAGTNQLHGTAFEFLRNEALNARNYFAPHRPGQARVPPQSVRRRARRADCDAIARSSSATTRASGRHRPHGDLDRAHAPAAPGHLHRADRRARARDLRPGDHGASAAASRDAVPGQHDPDGPDRSGGAHAAATAIRCRPRPGTANNYRRVADETVNQDQFDVRVDHRLSATIRCSPACRTSARTSSR